MDLGNDLSVCLCSMGVLFLDFYLLSNFLLYVAYG